MQIHPLFDRNSRYRQATADSIWSDQGVTSVQRFFQDNARRALLEEWQEKVPASAQDLGYSEATNQAIFETLRREAQAVKPELAAHAASEAEVAYAAPNDAPALLVFDLADPAVIAAPKLSRHPQVPKQAFTGISQHGVEMAKDFAVNLMGLERYRHVVLLLLTSKRLESLQQLLNAERLAGDQQVIALMRTMLSLETLTNTARQPGNPSLASRLFDILRLVPTLEGVSNKDGALRLEVSLGRDCPMVELGSWLVVCQGPSVA